MFAMCMCPNPRCSQVVQVPDPEYKDMIGQCYLVVKGCKPEPKDELVQDRGKYRWHCGKAIHPRPRPA